MRIPLLVLALLPHLAPLAPAQVEPEPWPHEQSDLGTHPAVRAALPNGMRYAYARTIGDDRARIWLNVAVGGLHEGPEEDGLAHLLEHLVFRGTENWSTERVDRWAAENGLISGPDLNAFTSDRNTIYLLDIPRANERRVREALEILRELTTRPLLRAQDLDLERPIVDAEESERSGPDADAAQSFERWSMPGLRSAQVSILGSEASRAAVDIEAVRAFHRRWYRPERMTLVMAGGVPDGVSDLIEQAFADFAAPDGPAPGPPDEGQLDLTRSPDLVSQHPGCAATSLYVLRARPAPFVYLTRERIGREAVEAVALTAIGRRLDALVAAHPDTLSAASIGRIGPGLGYPALGVLIDVAPKDERWHRAMALVEQALRSVREHGFSEEEVGAATADILRGYGQATREERTRQFDEAADWILSEAQGELIDYELSSTTDLSEAALAEVDAARALASFLELWEGEGSVTRLALIGDFPDGPSAAGLRAAWNESQRASVQAHSLEELPEFAHPTPPDASYEVFRTYKDQNAELSWTVYANGVELLHSAQQGQRVTVGVYLRGGRRGLPVERWDVAHVAEATLLRLGLEGHPTDELDRMFSGRDVSVELEVRSDAILLRANAAHEELAMQLDLLVAFLKHSGWRQEDFDDWRSRYREDWEYIASTPEGTTAVRFYPELLIDGGKGVVADPDRADAMTLDELRGWVEPELQTAPLRIAVWGGGDAEEVRDLVGRRFGALPERAQPRLFVSSLRTSAPRHGVRRTYELPAASNAAVVLAFPTTDARVPSRGWGLTLLADVLQVRVEQRVREQLGLSYGPVVESNASRVFPKIGLLTISVPAAAEVHDAVEEACLEVVRELVEQGVGGEELERVLAPRRVAWSERYWMDVLDGYAGGGDGYQDWLDEGSFLDAVGPSRINRYVRQYLDPEKVSVARMIPKEK